jgi:hypothetical protein
MAPALTTPREPISAHQAAAAFPLTGIARHIDCGRLLLPGHDGIDGYAYHCRVCRHQPAIPVEAAHTAVATAIASLGPSSLRNRSLPQLIGLLAGLKLDDLGRVVRLTWRALR